MAAKKNKKALRRYFKIWQITGERPFRQKQEKLEPETCSSCGHIVDTPFCPYCGQAYKRDKKFFSGTFDSIPFLNDDAKRTFVHLLLRPGYMISDYLKGLNSRYLAPMMALIIFYAFFSLLTALVSPLTGDSEKDFGKRLDETEISSGPLTVSMAEGKTDTLDMKGMVQGLKDIYVIMHLDKYPDAVNTRWKASLSALEAQLRSQGFFSFIGQLILLTLCLWMVFGRKPGLSFSASATVSSFILCQFCCFMMILLLLTLGRDHSLGGVGMLIIMTIDFHQLFDMHWRKALRKSIQVGILFYAFLFLLGMLIIMPLILTNGLHI